MGQPRVELKCLSAVNYSLVHAGVPLLSEVTVFNDDVTPLVNAELQFVLPGYAKSQPIIIPYIPAKGNYRVEPLPKFLFDRISLRDLPEPESVPLEVWMNKEQELLRADVKLLPPNAWRCVEYEVALAGFVMPHSSAVDEIVSHARFYLRRLLKGSQGFVDVLESLDPKALEKTIKAVYFCLQDRYDIVYEYEPRTYAPDWQMVRFHHQVLDELASTCIDLALLFAACLESIHQDPLIIIVKIGQDPLTKVEVQHAIIGCWRKGTPLIGPIIGDAKLVQQWVESGDILVFDPIGFSRTREFPTGMVFAECQEKGINYIKNHNLCYALDVIAARDAGVAPMPFGKGVQFERSAWLAIFRARREAERLQSPALCARHLLLGLLSLGNGLMRQVFAQFSDNVADKITDVVSKSLPHTKSPRCPLQETRDWKAIMQRVEETTASHGSLLATEVDLATALLETPSQVDRVLERIGLTRQKCLSKLRALLDERGAVASEWHSSGFI